MIIIYWIIGCFLAYGLLLLVVPKGTILEEAISLPPYWVGLFTAPKNDVITKKFTYGAHPRQYYLLCKHKHIVPNRRAIIIYFHGGGWRIGAPENFLANAQKMVEQGFEVVLPSYRRIPEVTFTGIREDLNQLLIHVNQTYATLPPIILGGMSAGGNVAAHICYGLDPLAQNGLPKIQIEGLFLLGAPVDLSLMRKSKTLAQFAGARDQQLFQQANPINLIPTNHHLPTLIIHGKKDGMVEYRSIESFYEKVQQANQAKTTAFILPAGTHLDVARWSYRRGKVYQQIINWLDEIDKNLK